MGSLSYDLVRTLSPFRETFFLYVKDQKLETSFFSYEVVYNNQHRTSLAWAYLHP